jgi:hypothetical protein
MAVCDLLCAALLEASKIDVLAKYLPGDCGSVIVENDHRVVDDTGCFDGSPKCAAVFPMLLFCHSIDQAMNEEVANTSPKHPLHKFPGLLTGDADELSGALSPFYGGPIVKPERDPTPFRAQLNICCFALVCALSMPLAAFGAGTGTGGAGGTGTGAAGTGAAGTGGPSTGAPGAGTAGTGGPSTGGPGAGTGNSTNPAAAAEPQQPMPPNKPAGIQ